jgi:hypothetical protein
MMRLEGGTSESGLIIRDAIERSKSCGRGIPKKKAPDRDRHTVGGSTFLCP